MEVKINNKLKGISESLFLSSIISFAKKQGFGVALWRAPQSDDRNIIIGKVVKFITDELDLNESGFVFHPYSKDDDGYIIKPVFQASYNKVATILIDTLHLIDKIDFEGTLNQEILSSPTSRELPYCDRDDVFIEYVINGINAIKSEQLQKVVPSRSKKIDLPSDFEAINVFQKLYNTYSNAFVSFVSIPKIGTWMGATPELLINVSENKYFKTVALAGTQQYDGATPLSSVAWTQKEIEEQALVSRYIINCFKKIRLREFKEIGPKTVIAGNLIHLKTTFEVDMESTNFPQLGSVMIKLLHPTSAICGMPQDEAANFIMEHEGKNRSFFSGFLGPVNVNNTTSIFVNLRCMQLFKDYALVYAGAGLTEDSDPTKELQETELKMNTLLNVINS